MATIADRSDFTLELEFTRIYRENAGEHRAVREARCLAWQLPRIVLDIEEDDLVPGGCHYGAVGFSSQIGGFLYYCHEEKIDEEIRKSRENPEYCQRTTGRGRRQWPIRCTGSPAVFWIFISCWRWGCPACTF